LDKNKKIISLGVGSVLLLALFFLLIRVNPTDKLFQVKKGDSFHSVAQRLAGEKIIRSRLLFVSLVKISFQSRNLRTGYYRFKGIKTIPGLIQSLTKGDVASRSFTIPEGFNIFQIADILANKGIVEKQKFLTLCKSKEILDKFNIKQDTVEGFLYPDTYYVPYGIPADKLVEIMIANFYDHINARYLGKLKEKYGSVEKGIIIASLVEWEAVIDFERPLIAGVLLNRLKKNLNLQSCATVQYALNDHKSRLLFKDLKVRSPYNTYLYKGLPPTPICNPSEKSVLAVIYPSKNNYLFFVSMQNGRHYFSSSYSQHLKGYKYYILGEKDIDLF